MIAAGPPPSTPPEPGSPWPFGRFPFGARRRRTFIIIGAAAAGAIAIGAVLAIILAQQEQRTSINEFAPAVSFVTFEAERQELRVGESTGILFNVQNSEDRTIDDARVVVSVEPEAGATYLSISNSTVNLPELHTNARTGQMEVSITATGTPAAEAVYIVRGTVSAEETRTDVREFRLTIRPQQN